MEEEGQPEMDMLLELAFLSAMYGNYAALQHSFHFRQLVMKLKLYQKA